MVMGVHNLLIYLNVFDICYAQASIRSLWKHYVDASRDIIFVVDAADPSRLEEGTCLGI